MCQGTVLSPLLYCIYVNYLLCQFSSSGYGVYVHNIICGSPMYASDMALIGHSTLNLQNTSNNVFCCALDWWYKLNTTKSAVVTIGEAPAPHMRNSKCQWHIKESRFWKKTVNTTLGFSVYLIPPHSHELQNCNAVGSRLHPATTLKLYKTFCLPILILWK